jgi:probable HAF family extracellular repeat protein
MKKINLTLSILGLLLLISGSALGAVAYTITDMGTGFGGGNTFVNDINDHGQAVGFSFLPGAGEGPHAFLYQNGQTIDLGTLGGSRSAAYGINNNGDVVGWAFTKDESPHAFLYSNNHMTDLGTLGAPESYAFGINDSDQIVGSTAGVGDAHDQAFLYANGTMNYLSNLGSGDSRAYSINANGQIVGYANGQRGFLYQNGSKTDLGDLGGRWPASFALSINDLGQIVGWSDASKPGASQSLIHAFLYSSGNMIDIGKSGDENIGSGASDINNNGQIVGSFGGHAYIYSDGTMDNLEDLIDPSAGWYLSAAAAINNSGQIVGNGFYNNENHLFLLTPVPEPSVLILSGMFCVCLIIFQKWHRTRQHP